MFNDIFTLINFFKYKNKITRVFFFENNFIEYHLAPYTYKNVNINETILVSLYKIKNVKLKKFKIFQFQSLFFLNLFFLILKTKYCYSSTPDIDNSAFQRSIFKKTKYIYIQHSPLGLNKIYRHNAFTHFDVVHVINSFQKDDLIKIAKNNNKKIKAWKSKYLYLSKNFHDFAKKNQFTKKKILIAPTWGTDFFKLNLHLAIKKNLNPTKYDIFIRPHMMSISKDKNLDINLLKKDFFLSTGKIDFTQFDLLITDWSGIYIEFAKINKIKSILIQNKEKILNDKFNEYNTDSIDSYARNKLGVIIKINDFKSIESKVDDIFLNQSNHIDKINSFFNTYFY